MKYLWIVVGAMSLVLALIVWRTAERNRSSSADRLLLLVPDGTNISDPKVTVWLDAASEEGLHITPVHDSEFVRPLFAVTRCAGLILPDSVHQRAGDMVLVAIRHFVAAGGKLMLVYDAGTLSLQGRYAPKCSRLSDLAGVNYALYDTLADKTTQWSSPVAQTSVVRKMDIPPGKYYPFLPEDKKTKPTNSENAGTVATPDTGVQFRRYQYGDLEYPSFVTSGDYAGRVLFRSSAGIVAGEHPYRNGSVLFVNLPLGYLKANTDGLPLHAFLKYFAEESLSLPYLMPVPDGVGGLVLNWHVDSNAAIKPLQQLESWTLFRQGPYSIHITAGPDDAFLGDKKGFDVEHNPLSRELIRKYLAVGHDIGSHGGWAHDYFAAHVDKDNPQDLEQFLSLNKSALERVTGKPVVSYSAPTGNEPPWVTRWLEAHGFLAYYFAGNTGMAPTQGYRDGSRSGKDIWAFPITHLDRAAAFEEMAKEGYSNSEIEDWLEALTQFTVDHRCVRLVYFHPPGILRYRQITDQWMKQTARLQTEGQFRWYTMSALARFLNSRKQVQWRTSIAGALVTIDATHPDNLAHAAWYFPSDRYSEPLITEGSAQVRRDGDAWLVVAKEGKELRFQTKRVDQP